MFPGARSEIAWKKDAESVRGVIRKETNKQKKTNGNQEAGTWRRPQYL